MNSLNKIFLSLALLLLASPAVKAADSGDSIYLSDDIEVEETTKASNSYLQKAKEAATSSKDAVVDYVKDHKKASIAAGLTTGTVAICAGLYRWCPSFRNTIKSGATKVKDAANNYVYTPVKNKLDSYSTKAKLGTAGGLTLGALATYFGIQKLKQYRNSSAEPTE